MAAHRHGAEEVAESSTFGSAGSRKGHWVFLEHLRLQSPPPMTPFFQQGPLLIVPRPRGPWGPFSFSPPKMGVRGILSSRAHNGTDLLELS